jgi:hypothetical protein
MEVTFGVEKLFRDASIFLHMDATTDIPAGSSAECHTLFSRNGQAGEAQ